MRSVGRAVTDFICSTLDGYESCTGIQVSYRLHLTHATYTNRPPKNTPDILTFCCFDVRLEDPRSLPIHAILCNYDEDFISCAPILFRNVPLRAREFSHASVSLRRFSLSRSNHTFIERLFLKGINQTSSTIRLKRAEFCLSMSHLNIRKSPGRKLCGRFFEKRHRYHARTHTYTHIQHTPLHTPKRVQQRSGGRAAPGWLPVQPSTVFLAHFSPERVSLHLSIGWF